MERRTLLIVAAVIVVLVVVPVAFLALLGGQPSASSPPSPSAAPSASASVEASVEPTPDPGEAPSDTPAPSEEAGPIEVAWTPITGLEPDASINGVAFLDGTWVAVGTVLADGAIWTSDDGTTWTRAEVESTRGADEYTSVSDVVALDETLVAIGAWGSPQIPGAGWITWTSTDGGATWAEMRDGPEPLALRAISTGGPGIVAAGWGFAGASDFDGWLAVSSDGFTWQRLPTTLLAAEVHAITTLGDRIVAVGNQFVDGFGPEAKTWYSDDGVGWTWVNPPDGGVSETIYDIVAFDGGLVAIGGGGGGVGAWVTSHGANWERFDVGAEAQADGLVAVDGGLVAVGNIIGQDIGPGMSWTSVDGREWLRGAELGNGSVRLMSVDGDGTTVVAGGNCLSTSCETVLWIGEVSR